MTEDQIETWALRLYGAGMLFAVALLFYLLAFILLG
jgi:hypothetical protein